ncbi:hypothetical protein AAFC00_000429 [Neodothiora populina]|uniref:Pre-mRNA-splicing factor SYF2 n=1 Tax=Neodothiora populina TaxID=2781224 RepID=A0ABR3PCW8_9PEZI
MPTTLKRKSSPGPEDEAEPPKRRFAEAEPQSTETAEHIAEDVQEEKEEDAARKQAEAQAQTELQDAAADAEAEGAPSEASTPTTSTASKSDPQKDRLARFAALRARNNDSRAANQKATVTETARLTTDPSLLSSLSRKRDIAAEKLLKADTEDAGEDYERKRAWDWTIDESEKWDRKLSKKARNKANNAFQDYSGEANKVYKRQLKEMKPDRENYEKEKRNLIERATASGGLEVVETEDGELIAVDRDGTFYSTADSTDFVSQKPSKEAVDKLVGEIRKQEEVRNKNRRNRKGGEDDADVTYINDKNKQFNQKLARFYNKYTADIRESFERGTAL